VNVETMGGQALPVNAASVPSERPMDAFLSDIRSGALQIEKVSVQLLDVALAVLRRLDLACALTRTRLVPAGGRL
jgi:hypothetical protein